MKINSIQNPNNFKGLQTRNANPSFGSSVLQSLGNKVVKSKPLQKINKYVEFNGYNMTLASLAFVCYGAVLVPRLIFARDEDEFKEILVRDVTSITALLYGKRVLQNVISKACSKISGLALAKFPEKHQGLGKQVWNYLRPENGVNILSTSELVSKYTHIDKFQNGIVDFCQFITKSGGNVSKVFKSDKKLADIAKTAYEKANMGDDFASASSEKITEAFTKLHNNDKKALNGIYDFFANSKNSVVQKSRIMNSTFDFLATFLLIPGILGYGLPKLTEKAIKDKYKNAETKPQQQVTPAQQNQKENNQVRLQTKTPEVFKEFV